MLFVWVFLFQSIATLQDRTTLSPWLFIWCGGCAAVFMGTIGAEWGSFWCFQASTLCFLFILEPTIVAAFLKAGIMTDKSTMLHITEHTWNKLVMNSCMSLKYESRKAIEALLDNEVCSIQHTLEGPEHELCDIVVEDIVERGT